VPTIGIKVADRIQRHLAAVRLMAYMLFPDSAELRAAGELVFATKLAGWYSDTFEKQKEAAKRRVILGARSKLGNEFSRALADPSAWMRRKLFDDFLKPFGGALGGAVELADSPSASWLDQEWARRWFDICYTGQLICLIGSIHRHHTEVGASLNKAIHVMCKTQGTIPLPAVLTRLGVRGIYESSLKEAWRVFKPVAHLCAAYVMTETHFYEEEFSRDFWEYWAQSPAFHRDDVFGIFCIAAKAVERFATSYRSHGQSDALISEDEIYALPDAIFGPGTPYGSFRPLSEHEVAALKTYRAPKQIF
jgi:hypothetical protein